MSVKKSIAAKTNDKTKIAPEKTRTSERKPAPSADTAVAMDCRSGSDRRNNDAERRKQNTAVVLERRVGQRRVKVNRRRQIDPTTCERDYTPAELEFMHAMDDYKRRSGRMFPTCSEILEVVRDLGYEKPAVAAAVAILPELPSLSASREQVC